MADDRQATASREMLQTFTVSADDRARLELVIEAQSAISRVAAGMLAEAMRIPDSEKGAPKSMRYRILRQMEMGLRRRAATVYRSTCSSRFLRLEHELEVFAEIISEEWPELAAMTLDASSKCAGIAELLNARERQS